MAQLDILTTAIILFIIVVITFISVIVYNGFYNALIETNVFQDDASDILTSFESDYVIMDYLILFLVVGLLITLFLSGFFIQSHPIFAGITILISLFDVVISVVLTNGYSVMANTFPNVAELLPISTWIMGNIPLIIVIDTLVFAIGLFVRPSGGINEY